MTIVKIMETLVDIMFSIVIMTYSDYDPESINKKKKTFLKSSCENEYSKPLTMRYFV